MKVLVTGSRDYEDRLAVYGALDWYLSQASVATPMELLVGDCPTGADLFAQDWRFLRIVGCYPILDTPPFAANWNLHGRGAGPKRNARMVAERPDACLGFFAPPPAGNRGTIGCCLLAEAAGIPVTPFGYVTAWTQREDGS